MRKQLLAITRRGSCCMGITRTKVPVHEQPKDFLKGGSYSHQGRPHPCTICRPDMHQAEPNQTSSFAPAMQAFSTASKAWKSAMVASMLVSESGNVEGSTIGSSMMGGIPGMESPPSCWSKGCCADPSGFFRQNAQLEAWRIENGSGSARYDDVDGSPHDMPDGKQQPGGLPACCGCLSELEEASASAAALT